MSKLVVETNQSKSYSSPSAALQDEGYQQVDNAIFEKNGKKYKLESYDHFNATIYSITLQDA